jgi:hypothetical protein
MSKRSLNWMLPAALAMMGCGSGNGDDAGGSPSSPIVIGRGGGGSTPVTGAGGSGAGSNSGTSCALSPDQNGCVGEQFEGEGVPLDVYILFDQSCSMSCPISRGGPGQCCSGGPDPRIAPVRAALDSFLHDPESRGIGFGLGYFGFDPLGQATCNPAEFDHPAIAIAQNQADTLMSSLNAAVPTGETPTGAALRGACSYIRGQNKAHPGRQTVVLLVTDGIPETPVSKCGATLPDAVQAAIDCLASAQGSVKTYVLGVGQALSNLDQIAQAGGTKKAYLVDGGDVTSSILSALNSIRGDAAIPCQLEIPPPPADQTLDLNLVNVGVCDGNGVTEPTPNVVTADRCGNSPGWYYDSTTNPQRIMLCKASCATVTAPSARLYFSVGCATQVTIR